MTMPETSIWLALSARVKSLVLDPVHPVSWPNEDFKKPQKDNGTPSPYLVVQHFPNKNSRLFLGSTDPQHMQGILQISIYSSLNQDSSVMSEFAGQVVAHFPTDMQLTNGDIRLRVTKRPDVGQGLRDSTYWMTPVSISYELFV